ncbi:hypothetical protein DPMN_150233 [Dreissena polymorpha]|uniref:CCHC-type domain-containing protein n=1 Tax=Dreissena polymorpha TaxID=45954 RepID=A0A9D4FFC5_DREPO|nr:hypothetical protein DPMN_150233 [Dreissena polymorpha]
MWAIENQKSDYAKEVLSEVAKKIHTRNKHMPSIGSFRGYSGWGPQLGPCFTCGQVGHIRRTCPTTRGQQASAQARKY